MDGNFAFLSALLWHLDRLATLAGPLWPGVRTELQRLLADVIAEKSAKICATLSPTLTIRVA